MREFLNAGAKEAPKSEALARDKDDSAADIEKPANKAVAGGASLKGRSNSAVNAAVAGAKKGGAKKGGANEGPGKEGEIVRFSVGKDRSQDDGTNATRRQLGLGPAKNEGDSFDVALKMPKKEEPAEGDPEAADKGGGKKELDIDAAEVEKKAADPEQDEEGEGKAGAKDTDKDGQVSDKDGGPEGKDKDKGKDQDKKADAKKGGGPKESAMKVGGGAGEGAAQPPGPAPAPAPSPSSGGPKGSLKDYMDSPDNHDAGAKERVDGLVFVKDKVLRDGQTLHANIKKPPDKGWLSALNPTHDFAAFSKAGKGNKWRGQDKVLSVAAEIGRYLNLISGVTSKIGLACTIGGAILLLLVPPVGAFLLTVGRICNVVSVVCAGLKLIISIVKSVVLAVKVAKEKDPLKRLEMMQEMKTSMQEGALAGIEIILAKIGGKAKGAAKTVKSKVVSAAKATYKKGAIKAAIKAVPGKLGGAIKTAFKEGGKGLKNKVKMIKELGVGGTVRAIGKGAKSRLTATFVKPIKDVGAAFGGFKHVGQQWKRYRKLVAKHGGGFKGRFKASKSINFPNLYKAKSLKTKLKTAFKDATKTGRGGYATQIRVGISGAAGVRDLKANKGKKDGRSDVTRAAQEARDKSSLASQLENAKAGGREAVIAALESADTPGAVEAALHERANALRRARASRGKSGGDSKKPTAVKKSDNRGKSPEELDALVKKHGNFAHLDDSTLQVKLDEKISSIRDSLKIGGGIDPTAAALDVGKAALDPNASIAKTALKQLGTPGKTAATAFMGDKKTAGESGSGGMLKQAADASAKQTEGAAEAMAKMLQLRSLTGKPLVSAVKGNAVRPQNGMGATGAKVRKILALGIPSLTRRADELRAAMAAKDPSKAADGTGDAAGGAAASGPVPPPAPKEGQVVPSADLAPRILEAIDEQGAEKRLIQRDVADSKRMKAEALKSIDLAKQYQLGLTKQEAQIKTESAGADKDIAELKESAATLKEGQAGMAAGRAKGEGEKGKVDAKAKEGAAVKVDADEKAKREKEREKAQQDREDWEAEYKAAWWGKKKWMRAKKYLFSFANLLKLAAKWIWKKLIAPMIKAIKKAIAKVMNFLTELMMKGVMSIVKLFLGEEEGARLDATFVEMKKEEVRQSKKAADQANKTQVKAKVDLTKAEKKAHEEVTRCDGNIATGKRLEETVNTNEKALNAEKDKAEGDRAAFEQRYTPYFEWVAKEETKEKQAQGGAGGGAGRGGGGGGGGDDPGGAKEEKAEDSEKHPLDKPIDPEVVDAIVQASDVIIEASTESETEITKASVGYRDKLLKKADEQYDALGPDIKKTQLEALDALTRSDVADAQPKLSKAVGAIYEQEDGKVKAVKDAADKVHTGISTNMTSEERARRGRVELLKSQAAALLGAKGPEVTEKLRKLTDQLAKEAAGVDSAKGDAYAGMLDSYVKAAEVAGG